MSQQPSPLALENLTVRYPQAEAPCLGGVSLVTRPGEVVLLLGPSGSGKSTLALAACGLIPHAVNAEMSGRVMACGLDTAEHPVAALGTRVSVVFQDPDAQIITSSVLDEVCFGPENLCLPVDEVMARAEEALRKVGLWERRYENPDRLSGGGRQRLAIACALAMRSPVLVLDEPTANLDPAGIEDLYAALADVIADGSHSTLLIEHNLDACIGIVDRVAVVDQHGNLVRLGTVDDVLRHHHQELSELGVWLPHATLAALRLRDAGLRLDPLPLTPDELRLALDTQAELPPLPTAPAATGRQRTPIVSVRDLSITRSKRTILDGITFDIDEGDFVAIVGINGAGKTTLLHAIAGVAPPPRGHVHLRDLDPATASPRELAQRVGFVFQNPEHQFIRESVADELAHGLTLQGADPASIDNAVQDMLVRFGLTEHRDLHPFLLSGGQKRRLSVATALITSHRLIALDEPTFGQDREHAGELLETLDNLNEAGTTILVVTHDMQLVADHANKVAVLADGHLLGFGPTERILASDILDQAGLRRPPLAAAMSTLQHHPRWRTITRINDIPGGAP